VEHNITKNSIFRILINATPNEVMLCPSKTYPDPFCCYIRHVVAPPEPRKRHSFYYSLPAVYGLSAQDVCRSNELTLLEEGQRQRLSNSPLLCIP